jgi:hypothetical protein
LQPQGTSTGVWTAATFLPLEAASALAFMTSDQFIGNPLFPDCCITACSSLRISARPDYCVVVKPGPGK